MQRYLHENPRPLRGAALNRDVRADRFGPRLHVSQSIMPLWSLRCRVEPAAIVFDLQSDGSVGGAKPDTYLGGGCVLVDVAQGLVRDEIKGHAAFATDSREVRLDVY